MQNLIHHFKAKKLTNFPLLLPPNWWWFVVGCRQSTIWRAVLKFLCFLCLQFGDDKTPSNLFLTVSFYQNMSWHDDFHFLLGNENNPRCNNLQCHKFNGNATEHTLRKRRITWHYGKVQALLKLSTLSHQRDKSFHETARVQAGGWGHTDGLLRLYMAVIKHWRNTEYMRQ